MHFQSINISFVVNWPGAVEVICNLILELTFFCVWTLLHNKVVLTANNLQKKH
jgi:hypothetical protein